jgi:hypothetical protein
MENDWSKKRTNIQYIFSWYSFYEEIDVSSEFGV